MQGYSNLHVKMYLMQMGKNTLFTGFHEMYKLNYVAIHSYLTVGQFRMKFWMKNEL